MLFGNLRPAWISLFPYNKMDLSVWLPNGHLYFWSPATLLQFDVLLILCIYYFSECPFNMNCILLLLLPVVLIISTRTLWALVGVNHCIKWHSSHCVLTATGDADRISCLRVGLLPAILLVTPFLLEPSLLNIPNPRGLPPILLQLQNRDLAFTGPSPWGTSLLPFWIYSLLYGGSLRVSFLGFPPLGPAYV